MQGILLHFDYIPITYQKIRKPKTWRFPYEQGIKT
jgi:hypothetical protein